MSERLDSDQGDEHGVGIPTRQRHYMALDVPTRKWDVIWIKQQNMLHEGVGWGMAS